MTNRLIRGKLEFAARCPPRFGKPLSKNLTPHQAAGIAFERKVHKALAVVAKSIGATFEYQPWFTFKDDNGPGACAADFLFRCEDSRALIVECKLTHVPIAAEKLRRLYIPVVTKVLGLDLRAVRACVVCKNLSPTAINISTNLSDSFLAFTRIPIIQWLGHGPISW